jgi:hypothetical protein
MHGRALEELRIRSTGATALRLAVRIVDPDGLEIPVTPTWTAEDESTVVLSNVPLRRLGEYRVYVVDKSRGEGTAQLTARFRNPRPGDAVHGL